MRSLPLMAFALPVAVSATHRSMPFSFVLRNARCAPSGENFTFDRLACGGTVTFTSLPSATFFSVMPVISAARCGPYVLGFTRVPAMRSIGCASSVIVG